MAKTKYISKITIVTADVANSWFGGLAGTTEGAGLPLDDPRISGHRHDGLDRDGSAAKVSLVDHVTDQITNSFLADDAVTNAKILDNTITQSKLSFALTDAVVGPETFVFRPTGIREGNIYNDFTELYADFAVTAGSKIIAFDSSLVGGIISIPAGIYDFEHTTWSTGNANPNIQGVGVSLDDGVTIRNLYRLEDIFLSQVSTTTSALIYDSGGSNSLYLNRSGLASFTPGVSSLIRVAGGSSLGISITSGLIFSLPGTSVVDVAAASTLLFSLSAAANVSGSAVSGAGDILRISVDSTSSMSPNPADYPGLIGSILDLELTSKSNQIDYDNSSSGLIATNVEAAIDEVALLSGGLTITGTDNRLVRVDGSMMLQDSAVILEDYTVPGTGRLMPNFNSVQDLGSITARWRDLYLATGSKVDFNGPGTIETVSGDLTLKPRVGGDVVIEKDAGIWARFDEATDSLAFGGTGLGATASITAPVDFNITLAPGADLLLQTDGADRISLNSGFLSIDVVNGIDIERLGVDSGSIIATSSTFGISAAGGTVLALDSDTNNDIEFRENGSLIAAFNNGFSTFNPLVLAGTSSASDALPSAAGTRLYATSNGVGPQVEFVNENPLPTTSGGEILRLVFSSRNSPQSAQKYIRFYDSGGNIGEIEGDGAGGVSYTPFTGSHIGQLPRDHTSKSSIESWMIMSSTGFIGEGIPSPDVILCSEEGSNKVMGVHSGLINPGHDRSHMDRDRYLSVYHAVGDGFILVTNKSGEVVNGDLIESSSVPGYGQLQSDHIFRAKTVAKCTQDVDWSSVKDTIDGYKYKLVSCTYHCG